MIWTPFKWISKNFLGIDIGTSSVKIVELSGWRSRKRLENYGEMPIHAVYEKEFRTSEKSSLTLSVKEISRAISAIIKEANIKNKSAVFSIPDFSSFFTSIELPAMTKEELPQAISYEARQHIPLPLSEVTLDWQIIKGELLHKKKSDSNIKVLLVAVPNEVIKEYKEIAKICNLDLSALEAEVFGVIRSIVKDDQGTVLLVDIGSRTSVCSVVDKGVLRSSSSFDISANQLTNRISESLNIDFKTAENIKEKYGITENPITEIKDIGEVKNTKEILIPLIDLILREIKKTSTDFYRKENKEINKIILVGGSARLTGLKEYINEQTNKRVEIGNPFSDIFYPPILEENLMKIAPSYAIATGMALRGLE